MKIFYFDEEVIANVLKELNMAKKYIRIAIFQIHSISLFDLLAKKTKEGIAVEILTLPFDSINENIREEVKEKYELLKKKV